MKNLLFDFKRQNVQDVVVPFSFIRFSQKLENVSGVALQVKRQDAEDNVLHGTFGLFFYGSDLSWNTLFFFH
jgi:hypothetical protein